jgi:hypothetical protein
MRRAFANCSSTGNPEPSQIAIASSASSVPKMRVGETADTCHGPAVCADGVVAFAIRNGEKEKAREGTLKVRTAKPRGPGRHAGLEGPLDRTEASGARMDVPSPGGHSSLALPDTSAQTSDGRWDETSSRSNPHRAKRGCSSAHFLFSRSVFRCSRDARKAANCSAVFGV